MNYREASKKYRKAIYLLDNTTVKTDAEENEWKRVMLKLNLNMSQVCLKQQKPKKTIFYCKEVLYLDPENVKALFRYGSSLRILQDFDRSRMFLLRAYKLNPSCSDITKEIQALDTMVAKYRALQKDIYKRMFNFDNEKQAIKGVENETSSTNKSSGDFFIEDKDSLHNSKVFIEKRIK
jgi:tetratricopeptide (TPR) repeat protein